MFIIGSHFGQHTHFDSSYFHPLNTACGPETSALKHLWFVQFGFVCVYVWGARSQHKTIFSLRISVACSVCERWVNQIHLLKCHPQTHALTHSLSTNERNEFGAQTESTPTRVHVRHVVAIVANGGPPYASKSMCWFVFFLRLLFVDAKDAVVWRVYVFSLPDATLNFNLVEWVCSFFFGFLSDGNRLFCKHVLLRAEVG